MGEQSEIPSNYRVAAEAVTNKQSSRVTNPIARTNMSLGGVNPDFAPSSPLSLPDHRYTEALKKELGTQILVSDPESGQRLNLLKANWGEFTGEESVTVFLPPYNNAIGVGSTHHRVAELARQLATPVVAIDHPGMGGSDRLTKEQKTGKEDSYLSVADAELRVLKSLGVKEINLAAVSMGAFAALAIAAQAAEQGIIVRNAVLIELPGVEKMSSTELGKRFLASGETLALHQASPFDPAMVESSGLHNSAVKQTRDLLSWAASTPGNDPFLRYWRGMSHYTAEGRAVKALSSQAELRSLEEVGVDEKPSEPMQITFINGGISTVSPLKEVTNIARKLKKDYPDQVRQLIFPGEDHPVMENAKRFGAITKLVLQGSAI